VSSVFAHRSRDTCGSINGDSTLLTEAHTLRTCRHVRQVCHRCILCRPAVSHMPYLCRELHHGRITEILTTVGSSAVSAMSHSDILWYCLPRASTLYCPPCAKCASVRHFKRCLCRDSCTLVSKSVRIEASRSETARGRVFS
jgi:hypothetical protein